MALIRQILPLLLVLSSITYSLAQTQQAPDTRQPVANPPYQKTYFGPPKKFDYTLSGIVKDQLTGEALPFASIRLNGTRHGVTANADGYFILPKIPTDTSTLVVSYIGYTSTSIFLNPELPIKNFRIELSPSSKILDDIVVISSKENVSFSQSDEISVIKITPQLISSMPNIGEKDIMRSFQLMPGVSASNESSSGLYVRGGTPDQNLVLYDGFTVYHVDHLYGFFSAFNTNSLKDVQLYKGGFESRFGGRLSSVTEITGKDGNQKKFNLGGDISLLSVNLFTEIPIGKKFTSVIAFRRSYKGPIYNKLFEKFNSDESDNQTTLPPPGGGPSGGGPAGGGPGGGPGGRPPQANTTVSSFFYDLNGKFTLRPTESDILTVSIFNGTDKIDNGNSLSAPSLSGGPSGLDVSNTDLTQYGNIGASLKWSRKWTSRLYGTTVVSYSNFYSDRDQSSARTSTNANGDETTTKTGILEDNNLRDYSIKSDYQWDILDFNQLQFGFFRTRYHVKYTYAQNDTSMVLDRNDETYLTGGFLQNKFKLHKNKIVLIPGVRFSYFNTTGTMYYEPRLSFSLNLTDRVTLKAATGKYYQFVNRITREDILSGSKDFWVLSDDRTVPISSAVHYIVGFSHETNDYLLSAEGYYKKIQDITEYSLRFKPNPTGVTYDENFFSGYGYAQGIELLAQKKQGNFNGWISYTLGQSRNHFDIYSDNYFPANQDVTHELKVVALLKYKRWDLSATWIYATGRPYTAPSGYYSITTLDGNTLNFFTVTSKNGLRLPDYHRADFAVNYKLFSSGNNPNNTRREIGYIGLSIFNFYNRTNVWYKTYIIEENSLIETNVNYIGITPNITVSLKLR
jgi:ferric enterobactin receptor